MKQTTKTTDNQDDIKRGEKRDDGFRFLCYEKQGGRIRERWVSPKRWEAIRRYQSVYNRAWRQRQRLARMAALPVLNSAGGGAA